MHKRDGIGKSGRWFPFVPISVLLAGMGAGPASAVITLPSASLEYRPRVIQDEQFVLNPVDDFFSGFGSFDIEHEAVLGNNEASSRIAVTVSPMQINGVVSSENTVGGGLPASQGVYELVFRLNAPTSFVLTGSMDPNDSGFTDGVGLRVRQFGTNVINQFEAVDDLAVAYPNPIQLGVGSWTLRVTAGVIGNVQNFSAVNFTLDFAASGMPTGDFNASGQVEQGDLDLVLQNWGDDTDVTGVPAGWVGDLPGGQIEQTELDRVLQNWGSTTAPDFNGSTVPEPAALALLSLIALHRRRRRKTAVNPTRRR